MHIPCFHYTETLLPTGTTTPFKKGVYKKMLLLMQYSLSQIYKNLQMDLLLVL